jgi:spore germination cell wall hydrolase CwlJ-like protein
MNEHHSYSDARHLELGPNEIALSRRQSRRLSKSNLLALLVLILTAAAIATMVVVNLQGEASSHAKGGRATDKAQVTPAALQLPEPDALRPLSPEQALTVNLERPVVARPDSPSAAFAIKADPATRLRAIDCLSQAVYYEAASEGIDGGRAVAQIVLNRMRHPSYPNSVCGVVYQGSTRATGCQFTFTCDGSLARVPQSYLWARSRKIATDALAGSVFAPVGHATHYHADYVVPYWADSLDKVAVIGRHIFYRLRGATGSARGFSQRYAAQEPLPPAPSVAIIEESLDALGASSAELPAPVLPKLEEDRIAAIDPTPKMPVAANAPLAADLTRGSLIIGESTSASKTKAAQAEPCSAANGRQIKALGANSLSVGTAKPGC